ncbi:MAG TPA: alpha/beta hydrolase [Patescibacteria group bacterium]|nr:alpha/beta hydrolase [Patescibacteria group bacterium]
MLTLFAALALTLLPAASAAPMEGSVASADGVMIHFHSEGSGDPALVFVHGWSCDSAYWSAQVTEFAPHHRVVTLDLAGHGKSGSGRKDWTIPAFGADVAAVVRQLDLKSVVLVGHSMGGPVTVEAALLMPDRVKLLVPVDSLQNAEFKLKPEQSAGFLAAFEKDFPGTVRQFFSQFFPPTAPREIVEPVLSRAASANPASALAAMRSLIAYDLTASLPRLKAPIHAIDSDSNPVAIEVNRKYARRFDAVIMPGVGHFPMLVAPTEFNRLLADAVSELK